MSSSTDVDLRRMLDRQEIVDLLLRYASTIHAKYGEEVVDGADNLLSWIDGMTKTATWQHHFLNVYHVDFVSDSEAKTLTYHTSHQTTSDAPNKCRKIVARYYDTVRKVDGRWLIADKYMQVGWTQEFTADPA